MSSNRLAVAALSVGCLAAAAGGGYFAMRQNTVPTPTSAAVTPAPSAPANDVIAPAYRSEERVVEETPRVPESPQRSLDELVVSASSVIGLQTESGISSETARIEDRVEARVTRDVKVAD